MARLAQWALAAISLTSTTFSKPLSPNAGTTLAPLVESNHVHGSINNSYIVMLKNDLPAAILATHMNFLETAHAANPFTGEDVSGVQQVYDGHITGYAGRFAPGVVDQIRHMPEVAYVEKDQIVKTQEVTTQKSAPWVS
jgi:cerevisin